MDYKKVFNSDYFTAYPLLTRGAPFNFVDTVRNVGKTYTFRKRSIERYQKKGKKTIWVRFFKEEAKETAFKFLTAGGLAKNEKWTDNDVVVKGLNVYARFKGGKLKPAVQIMWLSQFAKMRSGDDVDADNIIFDEYSETVSRLKLYHGNPAEDFIDLCFSIMRTHKLQVFLCGNNETTLSPFKIYLNIPDTPKGFEGIRLYKKNSVAVQTINEAPEKAKETYKNKWLDVISGTPYEKYLTENAFKSDNHFIKAQKPAKSVRVIQVDIMGAVSFFVHNGRFYAVCGADTTKYVYVKEPSSKYKKQYVIRGSDKALFLPILSGLKYNLISYADARAYERAKLFFQIFGL